MFQRRYPRLAVGLVAGVFLIPASANICSAQKRSIGDFPSRILVLDGSPVHDVGELHVHASNWGAIGSLPGLGAPFSNSPSAEWPAGSRVEYLFVGGLWVGATINGLPAVSTSAYDTEFRPSSDARDIVYHSSFGAPGGNRIPSPAADDDGDGSIDEDVLDGFDNDADGLVDEDYAAISDQMLSRRFRDDDPSSISIFPNHTPQHLLVHEESYQFSHPDFDDFVGFTMTITNDGEETLQNAYVGIFADGDVGHRDTPNYWADDMTAFKSDLVVDHGAHGTKAYDLAYWYDANGDGGQADRFCSIVMLDHPVDPTGTTAPPEVGIVTFARFNGNVSYPAGGDPTNDFERYELMATQWIEPNSPAPADYRTMIAVGPFAAIAPGQTIQVSFALVISDRDFEFVNVQHAAVAYQGQWFDLDGDPATGIGGKEHQEHWYLPQDNPVPVAITSFDARVVDSRAVRVAWETVADEAIEGFDLLRAEPGTTPRALAPGLLAASTREFVDQTVVPGAHYEYVLIAHVADGGMFSSQTIGVDVPAVAMALRQNAPNPFTETTTIGITMPDRSDVEVAIFDVAGRRVATLAKGTRASGDHELVWNGLDDSGKRVGAGVYFYRLESGGETLTRKLVLVR